MKLRAAILASALLAPRAAVFLTAMVMLPGAAIAQSGVDNTTVTLVSVNGGSDTNNPGTSCLKVSSPVSASCTGAFIAIPNNNVQLLATALRAKTTGSFVWVYYSEVGN